MRSTCTGNPKNNITGKKREISISCKYTEIVYVESSSFASYLGLAPTALMVTASGGIFAQVCVGGDHELACCESGYLL